MTTNQTPPRPSSIPADALARVIVDGLGREVWAWFVPAHLDDRGGFVTTKRAHVCMQAQWGGTWWWDPEEYAGNWEGRNAEDGRTPSAAAQCRSLYDLGIALQDPRNVLCERDGMEVAGRLERLRPVEPIVRFADGRFISLEVAQQPMHDDVSWSWSYAYPGTVYTIPSESSRQKCRAFVDGGQKDSILPTDEPAEAMVSGGADSGEGKRVERSQGTIGLPGISSASPGALSRGPSGGLGEDELRDLAADYKPECHWRGMPGRSCPSPLCPVHSERAVSAADQHARDPMRCPACGMKAGTANTLCREGLHSARALKFFEERSGESETCQGCIGMGTVEDFDEDEPSEMTCSACNGTGRKEREREDGGAVGNRAVRACVEARTNAGGAASTSGEGASGQESSAAPVAPAQVTPPHPTGPGKVFGREWTEHRRHWEMFIGTSCLTARFIEGRLGFELDGFELDGTPETWVTEQLRHYLSLVPPEQVVEAMGEETRSAIVHALYAKAFKSWDQSDGVTEELALSLIDQRDEQQRLAREADANWSRVAGGLIRERDQAIARATELGKRCVDAENARDRERARAERAENSVLAVEGEALKEKSRADQAEVELSKVDAALVSAGLMPMGTDRHTALANVRAEIVRLTDTSLARKAERERDEARRELPRLLSLRRSLSEETEKRRDLEAELKGALGDVDMRTKERDEARRELDRLRVAVGAVLRDSVTLPRVSRTVRPEVDLGDDDPIPPGARNPELGEKAPKCVPKGARWCWVTLGDSTGTRPSGTRREAWVDDDKVRLQGGCCWFPAGAPHQWSPFLTTQLRALHEGKIGVVNE